MKFFHRPQPCASTGGGYARPPLCKCMCNFHRVLPHSPQVFIFFAAKSMSFHVKPSTSPSRMPSRAEGFFILSPNTCSQISEKNPLTFLLRDFMKKLFDFQVPLPNFFNDPLEVVKADDVKVPLFRAASTSFNPETYLHAFHLRSFHCRAYADNVRLLARWLRLPNRVLPAGVLENFR